QFLSELSQPRLPAFQGVCCGEGKECVSRSETASKGWGINPISFFFNGARTKPSKFGLQCASGSIVGQEEAIGPGGDLGTPNRFRIGWRKFAVAKGERNQKQISRVTILHEQTVAAVCSVVSLSAACLPSCISLPRTFALRLGSVTFVVSGREEGSGRGHRSLVPTLVFLSQALVGFASSQMLPPPLPPATRVPFDSMGGRIKHERLGPPGSSSFSFWSRSAPRAIPSGL
ncbi:UNVERIFIED_CONTAM: hypothetical protein K2H54_064680, partial [Gekko kuhli]